MCIAEECCEFKCCKRNLRLALRKNKKVGAKERGVFSFVWPAILAGMFASPAIFISMMLRFANPHQHIAKILKARYVGAKGEPLADVGSAGHAAESDDNKIHRTLVTPDNLDHVIDEYGSNPGYSIFEHVFGGRGFGKSKDYEAQEWNGPTHGSDYIWDSDVTSRSISDFPEKLIEYHWGYSYASWSTIVVGSSSRSTSSSTSGSIRSSGGSSSKDGSSRSRPYTSRMGVFFNKIGFARMYLPTVKSDNRLLYGFGSERSSLGVTNRKECARLKIGAFKDPFSEAVTHSLRPRDRYASSSPSFSSLSVDPRTDSFTTKRRLFLLRSCLGWNRFRQELFPDANKTIPSLLSKDIREDVILSVSGDEFFRDRVDDVEDEDVGVQNHFLDFTYEAVQALYEKQKFLITWRMYMFALIQEGQRVLREVLNEEYAESDKPGSSISDESLESDKRKEARRNAITKAISVLKPILAKQKKAVEVLSAYLVANPKAMRYLSVRIIFPEAIVRESGRHEKIYERLWYDCIQETKSLSNVYPKLDLAKMVGKVEFVTEKVIKEMTPLTPKLIATTVNLNPAKCSTTKFFDPDDEYLGDLEDVRDGALLRIWRELSLIANNTDRNLVRKEFDPHYLGTVMAVSHFNGIFPDFYYSTFEDIVDRRRNQQPAASNTLIR